MPWEKWVNGKWIPQPAPAAPGPSLGSKAGLRVLKAAFDKLRGPDLRPAKRRLRQHLGAQLRTPRRPTSSPRPREGEGGGARMVAAGGRDGSNRRDDGSGGDSGDDGGGESGDGPPSRSGAPHDVAGRATS